MALKRLDEEFELKAGTQLLPYMKRLLPSLEGRFQAIEGKADAYTEVMDEIRAAALLRMNEILIPATEGIVEVTKLGFLLGPSSTTLTFSLGVHYLYIDEGPQRDSFTPSPYVIIERTANIDDYAIARVLDYVQETGELVVQITAWHGNAGPHNDFMVSSTPGMADSTKLYHDAVGPMHDTVVTDAAQVAQDKIEIMAAIEALEAAGLDVNAFIRRDGTVPFIARQVGVAPATGANDASLVTAAWSRARMIEYSGLNVTRTGDTMSGPLNVIPPTQPSHAASKSYVDATIGAGGVINGNITIQTVNPTLRLSPTSIQQSRMIEAVSASGAARWQLILADAALEAGGNAGADFRLQRHSDAGVFLDSPLVINRIDGKMTTKALDVVGVLDVNGNTVIEGDITVYRPATPTTGVVYMNQAKTAYHYYNGTLHQFTGGGITAAGPISGAALSVSTINASSSAVIAGALQSGAHTVVGALVAHGNLTLYGAGSNYITLHDSDWGPMYIHHNQDLIGFLGHDGGWRMYNTNGGHIWSPAYGWIHDYINGQANAYAWNAADYRYNQLVHTARWVYIGDLNTLHTPNVVTEIWGGCAVTGFYANASRVMVYFRFRQLQVMIAGGWYAVGYA